VLSFNPVDDVQVSRHVTYHYVHAKRTIFREGHTPTCCFYVVGGQGQLSLFTL
jgi:hypothetical protein